MFATYTYNYVDSGVPKLWLQIETGLVPFIPFLSDRCLHCRLLLFWGTCIIIMKTGKGRSILTSTGFSGLWPLHISGLASLSVEQLTPLEALNLLNQLKHLLASGTQCWRPSIVCMAHLYTAWAWQPHTNIASGIQLPVYINWIFFQMHEYVYSAVW